MKTPYSTNNIHEALTNSETNFLWDYYNQLDNIKEELSPPITIRIKEDKEQILKILNQSENDIQQKKEAIQ